MSGAVAATKQEPPAEEEDAWGIES